MILTEIRQYCHQRKVVSLRDLCTRFKTESSAMESMLEVWVRKGKLRLDDGCSKPCQGCGHGSCVETVKYYQWIG